jgi:hypothetical protein
MVVWEIIMSVRPNMGKVGIAIEAGRKAAANLNFSPHNPISTMSSIDNLNIADWQFMDENSNMFIFGINKWGDHTKKVAK